MKPFSYGEQFELAIDNAFAARDPAVRLAYLDLAKFYQEKLDQHQEMHRAEQALRRLDPRTRSPG